MSSETRELRQALEEAQAEARTARDLSSENTQLTLALDRLERELAEKRRAIEILTPKATEFDERTRNDEALQSELRRLRAEAEVGLSARQRYERSRPPARASPSGPSQPWAVNARWGAAAIGVAMSVLGTFEARLHPSALLACGVALCFFAATSESRN
jgi:hypothetical protein